MSRRTDAPEAPALNATPNPSRPEAYLIEVKCPYCSSIHTHGWSGPGDPGGHRVAHCWNPVARKINGRGYNITITQELEETVAT